MSMRKRLALCAAMFATVPALAQAPQFGQEIAPAYIAPWDISIGPDGAGLPPGSGRLATTAKVRLDAGKAARFSA